MISFVNTLLKENLDLPPTMNLEVERAHKALGPCPASNALPKSIVVKFSSYRTEEIVKAAWQKLGFVFQEKRVNIDHDYAPDVLKKRKEYAEAKRVFREKKMIQFQTLFPAKLRIFYQEETRIYCSMAEATKDMAERGLLVKVFKPPETWVEKIKQLSWRTSPRGKETETLGSHAGFKEKLDVFRGI